MKIAEAKLELDRIARRFWEDRGARIGMAQTVNNINTEGDGDDNASGYIAGVPKRLENGEPFVTHSADVQSDRGGFGGPDRLILTLWVRPILKGTGNPGNPIRFGYAVLK